jgi:hypothetical protein
VRRQHHFTGWAGIRGCFRLQWTDVALGQLAVAKPSAESSDRNPWNEHREKCHPPTHRLKVSPGNFLSIGVGVKAG